MLFYKSTSTHINGKRESANPPKCKKVLITWEIISNPFYLNIRNLSNASLQYYIHVLQVAGGATGIYRACGLKPGSVNQLLPNLRLQERRHILSSSKEKICFNVPECWRSFLCVRTWPYQFKMPFCSIIKQVSWQTLKKSPLEPVGAWSLPCLAGI